MTKPLPPEKSQFFDLLHKAIGKGDKVKFGKATKKKSGNYKKKRMGD